MNKILLSTTALVSLVASSALAMNVSVGGKVEFQTGNVSQKTDYKYGFYTGKQDSEDDYYHLNNKTTKMNNDAKIYIKADDQAANGMKYGAVAVLTPSAKQKTGFSDGMTDRTYIYAESNLGHLELGSNFGASKLMKVDASSIAVATGGAGSGDWVNFVWFAPKADDKYQSSMKDTSYISSSDKLADRLADQESARKITLMTPRISGFQAGLSFAPDPANIGADEAVGYDAIAYYKNYWGLGLNYTNTFNNVNLALSATFDKSKNKDSLYRDYKSYEIGGSVGTGAFSAAASYGNDGKSGIAKSITAAHKANWYTAGLGYANGPVASSLTYFSSKNGYTDAGEENFGTKAISLGAEYRAMAGMTPYVEVTSFSLTPVNMSTTADDGTVTTYTKNKGTVFILGTSVKF